MDEDRMKHSFAVANKMVEIAISYNLKPEEQQACFLIGLNHDIGYKYTKENENHNVVGGNILKDNGFKFWREVYYHGDLNPKYNSLYLNILNQADMQVDKYGNDVGYEARLEDIKSRYGHNSKVYKSCKKMIDKLKAETAEEWSFGMDNEDLIKLVLEEKKKATTYILSGEIPEVGEESIILYSNGKKACRIKIKDVLVTEFKNVPEEYALLEGEGSYKEWVMIHKEFFTSKYPGFNERTKVVIEVFEIVERY